MPRVTSGGAGLGVGATTLAPDPVGTVEAWIWDPRLWPADGNARRHASGARARWAVVLGLVGIGASVVGPQHHVSPAVDLLVAGLALVGTVGAITLGATTLGAITLGATGLCRAGPRHGGGGGLLAVVALGIGSVSMTSVIVRGVGALVAG